MSDKDTAQPVRTIEQLDAELRALTLAVAELASIQSDMMRASERVNQRSPFVDYGSGDFGGSLGGNNDRQWYMSDLSTLRHRTQGLLTWLLARGKQD